MPGQRLIDSDERSRKKPMRVLVLGMCRTGTTSISVALRKLKYTPHQMRDVLVNPKELPLWQEAINTTLLAPGNKPSSQRNLPPYGKAEFDKLLGDYDAVMDLPGCVFAKELIEAYPEAKVILTTRKYADWEQSMQESIWCLDTWYLFKICRILNISQLSPLIRLVHSVFAVHNSNTYSGQGARAAYDSHYANIRSLVPKNRLLEIDADADLKWEPMCKFLGTDVPQESYPKLNEEKAIQKNLEKAWWAMMQYAILMIIMPGSVAIGGLIVYMYADALYALRDEWIITPLANYMNA